MSKKFKLSAIFFLVLFTQASFAQKNAKADQLIGTYEAISEESNNVSHIKISKGTNGKYYGEIVWLKISKESDGKEKVDKNNPEPKLRNRKLIGLKMLNDFTYDASENEWNGGTIYNPATGKTYNSYIKFEGPDKLHIRGYIGAAWMGLGKTVYWTRLKDK
ncbi:MAG: DUF2147 domain-containing protein [Chloroflexota bacterium]|nr:DUF2147 domain-containing protein [Lentimicrobium sp.]